MGGTSALLAVLPLIPLAGSAAAYLVGLRVRGAAGVIATAAAALSFVVTLLLVRALPAEGYLAADLFPWMHVGNLAVDFGFRFDRLTAVMCSVVTGVGSLIHLYSTAYMEDDEGRHRFFAYLNLFLFAMLLLVLGANLPVLFVGWEGVGLCSYLLIGFWYENPAYAAAGRKAFVVNRIGDAGFLLATFLLLQRFGTLDFVALADAVRATPPDAAFAGLVAACFFVGATGKSAQIPLFVWLPDAMAGPTPVSALIHAATMVTAGVYLMARAHFLFDLAPDVGLVVCAVAAATAAVAATIALVQNDIKKVLAYSTVSQLGFMFLAAGAGAYDAAVFHLVTHAFFKACLFLGAGSVIHGCHHEQDMRQMGGLAKAMPVTAVTYGVSTVAIAGVFPFAGYHSKHAVLAALGHPHGGHGLAGWGPFFAGVGTVTAVVTAFYMTRSFVMTFCGTYRGHATPHESPVRMTAPLVVLALLACVAGVFLSHRLPEYLSPVVPVAPHEPEGVFASVLGSWPGLLGIGAAVLLYGPLSRVPGMVYAASGPAGRLLSAKYLVDETYDVLIVRPLGALSRVLWRGVDGPVIDGLVNGTAAAVGAGGEVVRSSQTGQIRTYALLMFLATVVVIAGYVVTG